MGIGQRLVEAELMEQVGCGFCLAMVATTFSARAALATRNGLSPMNSAQHSRPYALGFPFA